MFIELTQRLALEFWIRCAWRKYRGIDQTTAFDNVYGCAATIVTTLKIPIRVEAQTGTICPSYAFSLRQSQSRADQISGDTITVCTWNERQQFSFDILKSGAMLIIAEHIWHNISHKYRSLSQFIMCVNYRTMVDVPRVSRIYGMNSSIQCVWTSSAASINYARAIIDVFAGCCWSPSSSSPSVCVFV